jgi:hypothetical protein
VRSLLSCQRHCLLSRQCTILGVVFRVGVGGYLLWCGEVAISATRCFIVQVGYFLPFYPCLSLTVCGSVICADARARLNRLQFKTTWHSNVVWSEKMVIMPKRKRPSAPPSCTQIYIS